jgi:hypothetical protein
MAYEIVLKTHRHTTMKLHFYFVLISLLICCSRPTEAQLDENLSYDINADSLKSFAIKDQKIIAIRISHDTLCIVSTNKALYYPFGCYNSFTDYYTESLKNSEYKYAIDSAYNIFKIINIRSGNSQLEFIENNETNRLELLSGHIKDDSFGLFNGIQIGMDRTELLLKFFTYIPKKVLGMQVIELKSGLEGVWYYCSFSQNILNKIDIRTDYILSK